MLLFKFRLDNAEKWTETVAFNVSMIYQAVRLAEKQGRKIEFAIFSMRK